MAALLRLQGLVIRSRSYGEADRLLTLLTYEKGKINGIAKGVRKPTSRLKAGVQLFSQSDMMVHEGKNLYTITQAEPIESFFSLQTDPDRFTHASYMAELVDKFSLDQGGAELYPLLLTFWHLLSVYQIPLVTRLFELRFLDQLGYGPVFDACINCGIILPETKDPMVTSNYPIYSPIKGGTVGACCQRFDDKGYILPPNALALLNYLRVMDPREIHKVQVGEKNAMLIRRVLQETIQSRYEGRMRSWTVLETMGGN
ncbi:DNA repair protein RecO [Heliorestis convoluta]|uniref:DNA repair protein RecO n=1 Tax=Heliorestis convoluta TaxID=356322 RepID=A0A5Q2MYS2_9FIRM|nr:DNA repair protein RecO [Heliorestis convoluta]QGG47888.1 DNA repair protein RecO [Heliorestis convoluta]